MNRDRPISELAEFIRREIDSYDMSVGIFEDAPKQIPDRKKGLTADGRSHVKGESDSPETLTDIARYLEDRFHWLTDPVNNMDENEIGEVIKFIIWNMEANEYSTIQIENALKALILNPIMRHEYGRNSPSTIKEKGFDYLLKDTWQLMRAISARVVKKNV